MQDILFIDAEKCTGCRICEMYCSFMKTKTCNPAKSRVRVIKWETEGVNTPIMCMQCDDAPCMSVCPVSAISKDIESGMVSIDGDICIGCKLCMMICPFGAITADSGGSKVVKCDLCDGDPMCAKMCSPGAISFLSTDSAALMKKRAGMEKVSSLMRLALTKKSGGE
jgi:Fe-S-cluster-containing hydrogenase component 2